MKKAKAKKAGGASKKDDAEKQATTPTTPDPAATASAAADEAAAQVAITTTEAVGEDDDTNPTSPLPSLSQQSKARSTSFRKGSISVSGPLSPGPFSPGAEGGETAPEIYRKHVSRIEELERENKKLSKEAADAEKRWQRAEEELADLREREGHDGVGAGKGDGEIEKLARFQSSSPSMD